MRLCQLDLTRYGRFTDARLDFPAPAPGTPDLHVIFGPNEAGKSTLFSAWLDLLYGIPQRTKYDFLHAGPNMQIGATLAHAGAMLEVVRVKRNPPNLQDANGQSLPEAVMQAALAGLGRDGYAAMFSLDDDTLEQGGDSILASKGDLGEMLFAASAGLAGLGPQLDGIRKELDAFHRPRARNTALKLAKDRLQDLDRQRRELDITASAAQKLQRDVIAAEKAWLAARGAEGGADKALEAIKVALAVVPQQARLARLRAAYQPIADLPDATEADDSSLRDIEQTLQVLAGQRDTRAEARADLEQRQAALRRDGAILPLADKIAEAAGLHPLHLAALGDLPRRHDRLAEVQADLGRRLQALGLDAPAVQHCLAPAVMARLRALVARRDMSMQAVAVAQDEVAKAEVLLANARGRLGDPTPAEDLQSLAHLVARLRQTDPEAHLARAAQECDARDADLAKALHLLAPWRGTADALAGLGVPAPWQITQWEGAEQATARALRDAAEAFDRRRADLAAAQQAAPAGTQATPSLSDATDARAQREAAWATHLAKLTPDTAAAFERTLRRDDRITLLLAEAMAAARHAAAGASALARITADTASAEAAFHARQAERLAHDQTVATCASALGLGAAGVADLRGWLALREAALTALSARNQALATQRRAEARIVEATGHLATALGLSADSGFAPLWAEALARLDTAHQSQEAARRLTELRDALTGRKTGLAAATQAMAEWQADWHAARSGAALQALPDEDPGLAALLDDLDSLTRLETERAELADRIAKMQANSQGFQAAYTALLAALDAPETTPWSGISDRLAAAQQVERDHAQIAADLDRDAAAQAALEVKSAALVARRAELGDRLAWDGGSALRDHLANCLRASHLRREISDLEAELAPLTAAPQDAKALEAEAALLQDALTLARADSEARFAELTQARRALGAIGGDDGVAMIAAERANLLNALQDQARSHLARRFGVMAFEQGLRRYRDAHRSGMLARASDAFRQLTCGEYTGLAAQPEGTTEVLVALPAAGGSKLSTDLSKGTRFQLYLALRIAGYHELAKARPPVPFIADDIMETFDDARAERAFTLLGDMARSGQVIYLTHHQHLCDIARAAYPGARVVDLQAV